MNTNRLKYTAVISMIIDHIGMFFLTEGTAPYVLFRLVGRMAAPLMCFVLAEGYCYTSSKGKYLLRLFVAAIAAQPFYSFALYGRIQIADWNMIFTLMLSFLALWFYEGGPIPANRTLMLGALILMSSLGDWGVIAPIWVLLFYVNRTDKKNRIKVFGISVIALTALEILYNLSISRLWYENWWQAGGLLCIPFLYVYNYEKGSSSKLHKWFFYIFYPAHLLGLSLLAGYIGIS